MSDEEKLEPQEEPTADRIEDWDVEVLRRKGLMKPHPLLDCPSCYWRFGQCRCWR